MALPDPHSFSLEADSFANSWLQSTYDTSLNSNDDYFVSPHDMTLEPEKLSMWGMEDMALNTDSVFDNGSISGLDDSHIPSHCDDTDYFTISASNPPPSPASDAVPESEPEALPKRGRGRGRSRLLRDDSESSYNESPRSSKPRISKRQPHSKVERKYREGINAELERLRLAVPTLPRWDSQAMNSLPRPTKMTVLASAIDYIQKIEMERDKLQRENEVLKAYRMMVAVGS
jgi:hypothetical protein